MSSSLTLFYLGFKLTLTFDCFCNNTEKENFDDVKSKCNSITAKPLFKHAIPVLQYWRVKNWTSFL